MRGESHLRLFDARARGSARVQPHLAGVHVGKEILADQAGQAERSDEKRHEGRQHAARDDAATNPAGPSSGSEDSRTER